MKINWTPFLAVLALLCCGVVQAQTQTGLQWLEPIGGPSTFETVGAVHSDSAGFHYYAGDFLDSLNVGNGTLIAQGDQDIYVVKANGAGQTIWSKHFFSTGRDGANRILYDDGFVYLIGDFRNTLSLDTFSLTSNGLADFFVAKLDATNGDVLWARSGGSTDNDRAHDLFVGPNRLAFTASCRATYSFGSEVDTVFYAGETDVIAVSLDKNGTTKSFTSIRRNTSTSVLTHGVVIDDQNNMYMAGSYRDSVIVDTQLVTNVPNLNSGVLFKLDSTGTLDWYRSIPATTTLFNLELWRDSILLLPMYKQGVYTLSGMAIPQGFTLVRFSLNNAVLGATSIITSAGGAGDAFNMYVTDTSIYMAGSFYDDVIIQGATISTASTGFDSDPLAFRLDSALTVQEVYHLKGQGIGQCNGIAVDTAGFVILCGDFIGELYYPGDTIVPAGFNDGFIAKFVQCPAFDSPFSVGAPAPYCDGDTVSLIPNSILPEFTFDWYNSTAIVSTDSIFQVTASGTYYLITDSLGCRDTAAAVALNFVLEPPFSSNLPAALCNNGSPLTLTASPAAGSWTGNGISGSNLFTPANALVGSNVLSYNALVSGCPFSYVDSVLVDSALNVVLQPVGDQCENGAVSSVALFATPAGGVFSGSGVSGSTLSLSGATVGNNQVWYAANNQCGAFADTVNYLVFAQPGVSVPAVNPLCSNDSIFILPAGTPAGGVFSGNFVSGDTFDLLVAGAGTHPVYYTVVDTNSCAATDTLTLDVQGNPVYSQSPLGPSNLCLGDTAFLQVTSAATVVWSPLDTSYTQSFPTLVDTVVYFTVLGACQATDSFELIAVSTAAVTLNEPTDFCINDSVHTLTTGFPWGGTYGGTGVTGTAFSPAMVGLGTYQLIYTYLDSSSCGGADTNLVTVHDLPTYSIDPYPDTVCAGDSVAFQVNSPGQTSWSNGQSGNSLVQVINAPIGLGVIISNNNCSVHDSVYVDALPLPVVDLGADTMICRFDSILLSVASGFPNYQWSFSGSTTHQATFASANTGIDTLSVVVTDSNGCQVTESKLVTVDICGGLSDLGAGIQLVLYPNPSDGRIQIQLDGTTGSAEVQLTDAVGRLLRKAIITPGNNLLDLSNLAAGRYHLSGSLDGTVFHRQVLIR